MYIIFGMVEKPLRSQKIYNTAFITGPNEGYIGKQRKVYPEPVFEGATEVNVFQTRYGKIGIFICRDQRSPELSRLLALKGANLFCQPTYYSVSRPIILSADLLFNTWRQGYKAPVCRQVRFPAIPGDGKRAPSGRGQRRQPALCEQQPDNRSRLAGSGTGLGARHAQRATFSSPKSSMI